MALNLPAEKNNCCSYAMPIQQVQDPPNPLGQAGWKFTMFSTTTVRLQMRR
jgi:hypothetical protein